MKQFILSAFLVSLFFLSESIYAQTGNTSTGIGAGASITTGDYNVFTGENAGHNTNTGSANSMHGFQAGYNNRSGGYNTFTGAYAGYKNNATNNAFTGAYAGINNTIGHSNTFTGSFVGFSNSTGVQNVFNGYLAGFKNQSGNANVFVGHKAGYLNTQGSSNTFLGDQAGRENTAGIVNTFIGREAGYNTNISNSVLIGYQAGKGETNNARLHIANHATSSTSLIYGEFDDAQVGINTTYVPDGYTLAVNGKAIAEELQIQLFADWPDYVFAKDYNLLSLETVANHIEEKGHLPGIPSAKEVAEGGFGLAEMSAKLLEKVEELTLYVIDLKEENEVLQEKNQQLETLTIQLKELSTESEQLKERLELLEKE